MAPRRLASTLLAGFGWAGLLIGSAAHSALAADASGADLQKGKQVFMTYCATCHGEKGDGQGPVGKALNPPPRDFTKGDFKYGSSDQDLFDTMSNGAASKGGSPLMAPWGAVIPEADRWALVKFIRSLKKD
ncbi:MAG: c-type cytochrome [Myxococcota bacterium]